MAQTNIGVDDKRRKFSPATKEIVKYLNVDNAKITAFGVVFCCIIYHATLHATFGGDSCQWLLREGRFQGDHIWQPFGCMIHKYSKTESRNCLHYISYWGGDNTITFVGDSRIRQQYHSFVEAVSGVEQTDERIHADLHFYDPKIHLKVDFLWLPHVNESMQSVFEKWTTSSSSHDRSRNSEANAPTLVIAGSATWTMKMYNGSFEGLEDFKTNLSSLVPVLNKLDNKTRVLWMLQENVDEKLSINRSRPFLTNAQIQGYNRATRDILGGSKVEIWKSSKEIAEGYKHFTEDGLHVSPEPLDWVWSSVLPATRALKSAVCVQSLMS